MAQVPSPEQLSQWFRAVDADGSGQLSAEELQRALVNGDWSPFNMETVRLMDSDADRSGTIDQKELSSALQTFGYNLSDRFVQILIKQFDKKSRGDITFDNFIQVCVTIKMLTDSFRRFDTDNDGWIQIGYEAVN
ncbi:hypothetical protein DSO57_1023710 [Entomophthora muscae]|uniref:Uncharacterized protein n=1 Tax=Entomophthora muscae TaxID=34485 RepID=A0ACC2TDW2_9FUNG|nr:hypothetical protein DSO57_1023710 [Entomophthora muscae]